MQKKQHKYAIRYFLPVLAGILSSLYTTSAQEYFQQEVNYKIDVTLDDRMHELHGFETIWYINNSRDTLSILYFHLWANAYSGNNTELAKEILNREGKGKLFNDPQLRGYIDSLYFKVEGEEVTWNLLDGFPDICRIDLNEGLHPGDSIEITTPFHVKIPEGVTSRMGHIGESYQISQWYPKPAVYDRSGWHQMPYTDQGEYYSEYGSFDVSITLPDNYIVGATGNLANEEESQRLDKISSDTSWMKFQGLREPAFPASSTKLKTLRYQEEQIHDFAWFADKRFHVLKGRITLPNSGRQVTTWAMFTDQEAGLWIKSIGYMNDAIMKYSEWIGDYPYNSFTAVQSALTSGAGMEYPGLTVIGLTRDAYLLDEVLAHEISHMWFYSAIGSDERRYPFMDESIAVAYESRYMDQRYPGKKLWELNFKNIKLAKFFHLDDMPVQRIQELEWLVPARRNKEQSIDLGSSDYTYDNYGSIVYYKGGHGFNYLRAYLGDSLFDSIMHNYYTTWKNRHPMPADLRTSFEAAISSDLSWFFDDFLGTTKRLDYKMVRFKNSKLLIKNKGEMNSPLQLTGFSADTIAFQSWEEGFSGRKWVSIPYNDLQEVQIDPEHKMTELFRLNNNIHDRGIFSRSDKVYPRFLFTLDDPDKRSVIYMPAINWTRPDGFMVGAAVYNGVLIPKPVEYFLIPLYAFQNSGLRGYGRIAFNHIPYNSIIRLATLFFEAEKFGAPADQDYYMTRIGLDINFRPNSALKPVSNKIFVHYTTASDLGQIESLTAAEIRSYLSFGYLLQKKSIINPFDMNASMEAGKSYAKTSLEFNYRYSYSGKNRGLDTRVFAGIVMNTGNPDPIYTFATSGRSGAELYLYQGFYPDRFTSFPDTFWSRQTTFTEGGLVTPLSDSLGYSNWIGSITLTSSLPAKITWLPVKPFATIAISEPGKVIPDGPSIFFEAGLKAGIWDFFEIYFPLLVSENINSVGGTLNERIRFVFKLDKLNPLTAR